MLSSYGIRRALQKAAGLLALLLTLSLPLVQALQCYSCEAENTFECSNIKNCSSREKFCVIGAMKVYPRVFLVSKQCSQFCPAIEIPAEVPLQSEPKSFVIVEPLPLHYIRCCKGELCNFEGQPFNETSFREQAGKASKRNCGHTKLLLLGHLVLTATALLWP